MSRMIWVMQVGLRARPLNHRRLDTSAPAHEPDRGRRGDHQAEMISPRRLAPMTGFIVLAVLVIVAPGPDFALTLATHSAAARRRRRPASRRDSWSGLSRPPPGSPRCWSRRTRRSSRSASSARATCSGSARPRCSAVGDTHVHRGPARRSAKASSAISRIRRCRSSSPACCRSSAHRSARSPCTASSSPALTLVWLTAVGRIGATLVRPQVRRAVEVVTGVVLVALGLRVATERR